MHTHIYTQTTPFDQKNSKSILYYRLQLFIKKNVIKEKKNFFHKTVLKREPVNHLPLPSAWNHEPQKCTMPKHKIQKLLGAE